MEIAARHAVIACTLTGATLAFLGTGVVGLEFDGFRSQTAHAAFETLIGLVALVAAFLIFSRLQVTASRRDVWLVAALGLFGFAYFVFAVLPATFPNGYPHGVGVWGHAIGTVVAAGALAIGAVDRPLRIRGPGVWTALALGSCVLVVAGAAVILHVHLPQLSADPREPTEAAFVFRALQLLKASFFAIAAVGFLRYASRAGDLLSSWFAAASSVAGTAAVALAVSPRVDTDWVHIGDALRFAAAILLLCGVAGEIRRGQDASRLAARLEERRRVAYDLHDGLAQDLAYIATHVDSLAELPEEEAAALRDAAQRALIESREAIALLAHADRPLEPALLEAAEAVATREGIELEFRLEPGLRVRDDVRDVLVRVAREAVANAARHARAEVISVELRGGRYLRLRVVDDGVGFDPREQNHANGHFGLRSMERQALSVGGRLKIASAPGQGTMVEVVVKFPS